MGTGFLCRISDPATAYYYPAGGRVPWTFLYVCLEGDSARLTVADLVRQHGPLYRLPAHDGIMAEFQEFGQVREPRMTLSMAESYRLASDLFLALLNAAFAVESVHDTRRRLVRRALDLIDRRLEHRLTAGALATELRVSREHFTRVFTDQMGLSPYQYILRRKVRHACYLLKEGRLTNKEIAAQLNFSEAAHFTRAFKTLLRMTPRDFRLRGIMPTW